MAEKKRQLSSINYIFYDIEGTVSFDRKSYIHSLMFILDLGLPTFHGKFCFYLSTVRWKSFALKIKNSNEVFDKNKPTMWLQDGKRLNKTATLFYWNSVKLFSFCFCSTNMVEAFVDRFYINKDINNPDDM